MSLLMKLIKQLNSFTVSLALTCRLLAHKVIFGAEKAICQA